MVQRSAKKNWFDRLIFARSRLSLEVAVILNFY